MLKPRWHRRLLPITALALATLLGGCVVYPGYGGYGGGYGYHGGGGGYYASGWHGDGGGWHGGGGGYYR